MIPLYPCWGSIGGSVVKNQPTIAGTTGGLGAIPGLGRSLGEGNGNPLQHSCLGNPTEEPGGLQSMGLQRVGHNLATNHHHHQVPYSSSKEPFNYKHIHLYPTPQTIIPGFNFLGYLGKTLVCLNQAPKRVHIMLLCLVSFFQSMTRDRDRKFPPILRSMKFHDEEASWTHVQDRDSSPAPGTSSSPIFVDYWVLTSSHVQVASFWSRSWPCCGLPRLWKLTAEWGWDLGQSSREGQSPRPSLLRTGKKTLAWPKSSFRFTRMTFWPTQYLHHQIRGQRHKMGVCCGRPSQSLPQGWATQDQALLAMNTGVEERLNAEIWL